jgi:superfamily I DNA and/or RNA helicase
MTQVDQFIQLIDSFHSKGQLSDDDLVGIMAPIIKQVIDIHQMEKVANLESLENLYVQEDRLIIGDNFTKKQENLRKLNKIINKDDSGAFEIVDEKTLNQDIGLGEREVKSELIFRDDNKNGKGDIDADEPNSLNADVSGQVKPGKPSKPPKPMYVKGYNSYEIMHGHYDELTDIYLLGLVFASVMTGFDFSDFEQLQEFVDMRGRLGLFFKDTSPVILNLIADMTELDRSRRHRDLNEVYEKLINYRAIEEKSSLNMLGDQEDVSTEMKLLSKLKNRLFDISRRNRLLYFKTSNSFLNMTVASVPDVLDYKHINPDDLFLIKGDILSKIENESKIQLHKYLRFKDNDFIIPKLKKIGSGMRKDKQEYGFSQLRLVAGFLKWHNLKENKLERINSPLLLIPVSLKKKRGMQDKYELEVESSIVEVNPVLKYQLSELYGIDLPATIDLQEINLYKFLEKLTSVINSNSVGVTTEIISKPRMNLIHSTAKKTNNKFRNRKRKYNRSRGNEFKEFEYDYLNEYNPLAIQIFDKYLRISRSSLEHLIGEKAQSSKLTTKNLSEPAQGEIASRTNDNDSKDVKETKREFYSLKKLDEQGDPNRWEIDMTNIVLGNFNYKKMSLVRDYDEIIKGEIQSPIFQEIFSKEPKRRLEENPKFPLEEQYQVVPADPTQMQAIALSKDNHSYVIQGPPGTGKSQTITNLIAQYVGQGKRVLFISEKRAALDVVFYRLKQQQLDPLIALIHDSQSDKKAFVKDMKKVYNAMLSKKVDLNKLEAERNHLIEDIKTAESLIKRFNNQMQQIQPEIGIPLRKLLSRLVELKGYQVELSQLQMEKMPSYKLWKEFEDLIVNINKRLESLGLDPTLATQPVSLLNGEVILTDSPLQKINDLIESISEKLEHGIKVIDEFARDKMHESFSDILEEIELVRRFKRIIKSGTIRFNSDNRTQWEKLLPIIAEISQIKEKIKEEKGISEYWKVEPTEEDARRALKILTKFETSFTKFFSGEYKQVKERIRSAYDFSKHQIQPTEIEVIKDLVREMDLRKDLNSVYAKLRPYGFTEPGVEFEQLLVYNNLPQNEKEIIQDFLHIDNDSSTSDYTDYSLLMTALEEIVDIVDDLDALIDDPFSMTLEDINTSLGSLRNSLGILPELIPVLRELKQAPAPVNSIATSVPLSKDEMEKVAAEKSINEIYRTNHQLKEIGSSHLENALEKIDRAKEALLDINAQIITARIYKRFIQNFNISSQSVSTLDANQRAIKEIYSKGRKILEHEFNKKMRYKSVRELTTLESEKVIMDLKPIWLMSPLSVSDALPIDQDMFDVVIFDEASQITVEESLPQLYRARQSIIVGDEMQMPPTNFFSSKMFSNGEDYDDEVDEDDLISIDAESLLTQAVRTLIDVTLQWHYRSKYEVLISFSNAAFYNGNLLTIPDQESLSGEKEEIIIKDSEDGAKFADEVLNRSISFHFQENGVYENRSNESEAKYIAEMVRTLLKKDIEDSIGIVAFSQQQQGVIEEALYSLADEDVEFSDLLEKEMNRYEDDQFVGLFIKNLENVQGDERDIMILSICYGYNSKGKMYMNFGPINRSGGEKRLNVIFSRAKKHMAVVSSIHHSDITNEYNEGANYFKRFLQYAELISNGQNQAAKRIIANLANNTQIDEERELYIVTRSLSEEIKELGFQVENNVGESFFKVDIAVRKLGETQYVLGVLVDDSDDEAQESVLERYYQQPKILEAFGWNIVQVYTKDYYHRPDIIIEKIKRELGLMSSHKEDNQTSEEPSGPEQEVPEITDDNTTKEGLKNEPTESETEDVVVEEDQISKADKPQSESEIPKQKEEPENLPNEVVVLSDIQNMKFDRYEYKKGTSNKFWDLNLFLIKVRWILEIRGLIREMLT